MLAEVVTSLATPHAVVGVSTNVTFAMPACAAGDLLVLHTVIDGGVLTDLTIPAGWTLLGELQYGSPGANWVGASVAYKVATGSEPVSYTYASYTETGASLVSVVRGWDGNTANLRYAQQTTLLAARATPTVTAATTSSLVLHSAAHERRRNGVDPGGWDWAAPTGGTLVGHGTEVDLYASVAVSAHSQAGTSVPARDWLNSTFTADGPALVTTTLSIGADEQTVLWLTPDGSRETNAALTPGDTYQATWTLATDTDPATSGIVRALESGAVEQVPLTTDWQPGGQAIDRARTFVAAPGFRYGLAVTGAPELSNIGLRRRITSVLIEDEAVTADKLYANQALVEKITAALGEFDGVTTGWLKANDIATNALDAKIVTGMQITAGLWQTDAENFKGIKLGTTGLTAWDASGNQTFTLSATTGAMFMAGKYQSGLGQNRITIEHGMWPNHVGVRFHTADGTGLNRYAEITSNTGWNEGMAPGYLRLNSAGWTGDGHTQTTLDHNHQALLAAWNNQVDSVVEINNRNRSIGKVIIRAWGELEMQCGHSTTYRMRNMLGMSWNSTSVRMDEFARVGFELSSREGKREINPLPADYSVLDLEAVSYVAGDEEAGDQQCIGLIAEDVEDLATRTGTTALDALSVRQWVQTDELAKGELGPAPAKSLPTVQYDRIPVLLLPVLKHMNERLTALEQTKRAS